LPRASYHGPSTHKDTEAEIKAKADYEKREKLKASVHFQTIGTPLEPEVQDDDATEEADEEQAEGDEVDEDTAKPQTN
jgi:hypothetical protein